jgi:hypothetical protein
MLMRVPNLTTDGRLLPTGWKWGVLGPLWYTCFPLEGVILCGVHWAAPILLDIEACVWKAMVWGEDVHPSLSECSTVSRMEGRFWRKNSLGRRSGDNFWGSEPDLLIVWWCTCQQCGRVLSSGGSSYCSSEATWLGFCGTGPGWEGT